MNSFGGEKNLIFFNKEGDSLNLLYNNNTEKYEGKLFFDENSSDTFKSISLYTFEKINGFNFRLSDDTIDFLKVKKMQLFNEFDINFISDNNSLSDNQIFLKIEPSNNDQNYFTKWIYGNNFEALYSVGDEITFNASFTEFISPLVSYTIINKKKNAILIISNTSNKNFIQNYGISVLNTNNITISAINAIKIKNYLRKTGSASYTTMKNWNEPLFSTDLFINQKLSVVNSNHNDGVYTIDNLSYVDKTYHNYIFDISNLNKSTYLKTDISYLSENNVLYNEGLTFVSTVNKIIFNNNKKIPSIFINGLVFYIANSTLNTSKYTVFNINDFNQLKGYNFDELVLYNKIIYKCVQSYTFNNTITPTNESYWLESDFIYVKETITDETLNISDVHLYSNKISYTSDLPYIKPIDTTLNFVNLYKNTFDGLNIELYYNENDNTLNSDLIYPSKYISVDYIFDTNEIYTGETANITSVATLTTLKLTSKPYSYVNIEINNKIYYMSETKIGDFYFSATSSIFHNALKLEDVNENSYLWWFAKYSNTPILVTDDIKLIWDTSVSVEKTEIEKIISVTENIIPERNTNHVDNLYRELFFTDLDLFGVRIFINSQEFYIDTQFVYDDTAVNLDKTIDKTIRAFISKFMVILSDSGILIEGFNNKLTTDISYINAIRFTTTFPNVPLDIKVNVGSTAEYLISDKSIIFYDVNTSRRSKINVNINKINYFIPYNSSIKQTLIDFVTKYNVVLSQYGIIIKSSNNILYLYVKDSKTNISVIVNVGKTTLNMNELFKIVSTKPDNIGLIITSNQILIDDNLTNDKFTNYDFSTAQVFNLENSYKLNNKEYNILYLDDTKMCLSYQGAFFENITSGGVSGFDLLSFNNGFGYDVNGINITASTTLDYISKTFSVTDTTSFTARNVFVLNKLDEYYIIGDTTNNKTQIYIYNSENDNLKDVVIIDIEYYKHVFSEYTEYLYILGNDKVVVYDISVRKIVSTINTLISLSLHDITIDENGNYYISYSNSTNGFVSRYSKSNVVLNTYNIFNNTSSIQLVYNKVEKYIYAINQNDTPNVKKISSSGNLSIVTLTIPNIYLNSLYYNYQDNSIYGYNTSSIFKISNDIVTYINTITTNGTFYHIISNPYNNDIYTINESGNLYTIDHAFTIIDTENIGAYGYILFNNFDGNIYVSTIDVFGTNDVYLYSPFSRTVFLNLEKNLPHIKCEYNSNSKKIIGLANNNIIELFTIDFTYNINYRDFSSIYNDGLIYKNNNGTNVLINNQSLFDNQNYYGTLGSNYQDELNSIYSAFLLIKVRDYIRYPRENYIGDVNVTYKWYFKDDIDKSIFIYDLSSDLNRLEYNNYALDFINSISDISYIPNPLELHLGYNSIEEGVNNRVLLCDKIEDISMVVDDNLTVNYLILENKNDEYGVIKININSTISFTDNYFKIGQIIKINIVDPSINKYDIIKSSNSGKVFKIREVYFKELVLDYIDDIIVDETTIIGGRQLKYSISVQPKTIIDISLYGQTEIEDYRYKIELENNGKLIMPDDIYIFKPYDINEKGVDWNYLNKKRKEMILVRNDIYNYIGSYKAIINAINYFGYNDLVLNEYLIDNNYNSKNYGKFIKIAIPDMFNNSVNGWSDEFFSNYTSKYTITNLFNLSYNITDEDGNNIQMYSLNEVMIKLSGLKKWLEYNVVPISHKILDITGVTKTKIKNIVKHCGYDVMKFTSNQKITPVIASVTEVYKLPIQSGSDVYNVVIDFKTRNNIIPNTFCIDIKTYKTYNEWETFKNYLIGDKITYFGNIYESVDNNTNRNPLEYNIYSDWDVNVSYRFDDIISYDDRYYIYQYKTPTVTYDLDIFKNDLYNNSVGIIENYLNVTSDNQYSSIDIIDAMTLQTITPVFDNYNGTWSIYSNIILAQQYYENLAYNSLGYQVSLTANGVGVLTTVNYNITLLNVDIDTSNIFVSGNIYDVSSIYLDSTDTISPNTDYILYLRNLIASLPTGISIKIEYEKDVDKYDILVLFNKININYNASYIFNSNINQPKIRISIIYDISYNSNEFITLQQLLNLNISFTYRISTDIGLDVYTKYPNLITTTIKNDITTAYYNYATSNVLDYIKPIDINEAKIFVDNMLTHYNSSIIKYKLKYNNIPPIENIALSNPEFVVWNDITVWKKIKLEPVQTISEYRVNDIRPYNLTIDSKIDPYMVLNVTTDNDYGHSYKFEMSYEIKYNADIL